MPVSTALPPESHGSTKAAVTREHLRALEEQVLAAQNDRESVELALLASRATASRLERRVGDMAAAIRDLEQKLTAAEQSGELFARQLVKVNDSYHIKLVARDEELAREKAELAREKEAEVQQHQALLMKETELWKLEIGSLTKSKLELEAQRAAAENLARSYRNQLDAATDELKETKSQAEAEMARMVAKCWSLQEQLNALVMEKEDRREVTETVATNDTSQQTVAETYEEDDQPQEEQPQVDDVVAAESDTRSDRLMRVNDGLRALLSAQHGLAESVAGTKAVLTAESDKTQRLLETLRGEANELAIRLSGRDVALVARQNRIIQLEAQAKNDRQAVRELEDTLAKLSRSADRKGAAVSARLAEQKEHLELTLAVRRGLAAELQTKKQQLADADAKTRALEEDKRRGDVRVKQLQQQIAAMQLVHARELEKAVATLGAKASAAATTRKTPGLHQTKKSRASGADGEQNVSC